MNETTRSAPAAEQTGARSAAGTRPASEGTRKRLLALLGLTTALAAAGYGAYYYTEARFHEETDDAYVNGNLVQLTPQVSGTVVAVNALAYPTLPGCSAVQWARRWAQPPGTTGPCCTMHALWNRPARITPCMAQPLLQSSQPSGSRMSKPLPTSSAA